ncbi:MAG: hypothetical protein IK080_11315, partial [Clostridia bacterium]|nr:hypothetical protein [Clostridia bacterium]
LLSAVLLVSCCVTGGAVKDDAPIIIVPGFIEPVLGIHIDERGEEQLWPFAVSTLVGKILSDFPVLAARLAGLAVGNFDRFGTRLGQDAWDILYKLTCNPDGSSDYGVESFPQDPAQTTVRYLKNYKSGKYLPMAAFSKEIAAGYDADRTFVFCYNSQLDSLALATQLRAYIAAVKDYTGAEKVRLCSHSYGGQILAAYFFQYPDDCDAEKAVMIFPALAGTDAIKHILEADTDVPFDDIVFFLENLLKSPLSLEHLVSDKLCSEISEFASYGLAEVVEMWRYWGSMYALCSNEYYDALKEEFLDPVASAPIIEANDVIHYEMIPQLRSIFENCQAKGIPVSIISGSGVQECLGGDDNTDVLLPTKYATGAQCAKYGAHFSDGYEAKGTVCSDPAHRHVSPAMDIDASTAFLPENTWFVESAFHGGYGVQDYTMSLIEKLLFTDEIKDVYSDPAFPQFGYSDNVNLGVWFSFDASQVGYLSSDDHAIEIKNLNKLAPIKVLSVSASGLDLDFDTAKSLLILPGQSVKISFTGEVPAVKAQRTEITVRYMEGFSVNTMTRGFTVDNA